MEKLVTVMSKKSVNIEIVDWEYTCADKCCYDWGVDVYIDGEKIDEVTYEDTESILKAVLEKLGYKVRIERRPE